MPSTPSASPELAPASFDQFADLVTRELGIKMPANKAQMLQSRLMRRVRALGLESLQAYQHYLFDSPGAEDELVHFIDAVTTNKTDFFREAQHFDFLLATAIPQLRPSRSAGTARPFQVWCAGCSSGEEPYTLAMLLSEHAERESAAQRDFPFRLLATDISTRVLECAREGIYPASRIAPVPAALRQKYLLRHRESPRDLVRVAPALREKISFHRLNFMDQDYRIRDEFDVVFFRNVMIYFDRPTQEMVLRRILRHARPGAFLFVGHSESLSGLELPLRQAGPAIFQRV
jgi:chemotaxis protein methyltransferase CheR